MYGLNSKVPPIFSFFYKNVVKLTHTRDRYERNRLRRGFKRLFTSDQDYYVFSRIPVNEHTQIYVDFMEPKNPYLLLVYRNRVKVNSYWTEHTDKTITGIVGINDDGRLFCNLLPNDRVFVLELKEGNWFNHYKLLGYENEYNSGEPICLPKYKPVRVRVQGDLVFIITKWDIEELKALGYKVRGAGLAVFNKKRGKIASLLRHFILKPLVYVFRVLASLWYALRI